MKSAALNGAIVVGTGVVVVVMIGVFVLSSSSSAAAGALRVRGADVSFTLQNETAGNPVYDGVDAQPVEQILAQRGANYVRLRVWVDPADGHNNLDETLQLARRASAAGLAIILNLHYSDTWADRTSQTTPQAWAEQDPEQLAITVETYTREVVDSLSAQGTPAEIVQVGNEVTFGMLWPVGQIYGSHGEHWGNFTDLLKAAVRGAEGSEPRSAPEIMLDIDTGGDVALSTYFFDNIGAAGVPYDLIGLTYYPFWHGSLADLKNNVDTLATRYNKDVMIAETAYPWTLDDADSEANVVTSAAELPDGDLYPPTPTGQQAFYQALRQLLLDVPGGHGAGFLVWEPGWLAGVGAGPDLGNAFDNLTLFDHTGRALSALDSFAAP
jgi:arabinogalactan endo-1,4-beta-galactosidase